MDIFTPLGALQTTCRDFDSDTTTTFPTLNETEGNVNDNDNDKDAAAHTAATEKFKSMMNPAETLAERIQIFAAYVTERETELRRLWQEWGDVDGQITGLLRDAVAEVDADMDVSVVVDEDGDVVVDDNNNNNNNNEDDDDDDTLKPKENITLTEKVTPGYPKPKVTNKTGRSEKRGKKTGKKATTSASKLKAQIRQTGADAIAEVERQVSAEWERRRSVREKVLLVLREEGMA